MLTNWKIGPRLSVAFAGMLFVLLIAVSNALWQLNTIYQVGSELALERLPLINTVADAMIRDGRASTELRTALLASNPQDAAHSLDDVRAINAQNAKVLDTIGQRFTSEAGLKALAIVQQQRSAYTAVRDQIIAAISSGDRSQAQSLMTQLGGLEDNYHAALDTLRGLQKDRASQLSIQAAATYAQSKLIVLILALIGVIGALALSWVITRSITRPVADAVNAVHALAQGDLRMARYAPRRDEVGQLLQGLQQASKQLAATVSGVKDSVETISLATGELASGNLNLSQRTEEQAAALEQTAASMEELTATVRQNAEKAQQASALANDATTVAHNGDKVVSHVVDTMQNIATQSHKVEEIVGVIESIAFQTNILALNAAVEAARAGEEGRGFAVVANEVRSLAQRSASASKEIKTLIEASVSGISEGKQWVEQAGLTMQKLTDAVAKVNGYVDDIAAASHQQQLGIEQVGQAVTQMDTVTQQNAALVEEAAAASQSLVEQTRVLTNNVASFQLDAPGSDRAGSRTTDAETVQSRWQHHGQLGIA